MKFAMADSRTFTDYNTNCTLNAKLQKNYNASDIHAFRYHLQQNAEQVMEDLKVNTPNMSCTEKSCPVCDESIKYKPNGNIQ